MKQKVLIVEDDPEIAGLIEFHLGEPGLVAERTARDEAGLDMARRGSCLLAILDVMLPGMDGMEVCRRIRETDKELPILMLTAKADEVDKVLGLALGADDYLTKPFGIREFVARVKALIRRSDLSMEKQAGLVSPSELVFGGLSINLAKRRVVLNGNPVELTAKEFDRFAETLLEFLRAFPGWEARHLSAARLRGTSSRAIIRSTPRPYSRATHSRGCGLGADFALNDPLAFHHIFFIVAGSDTSMMMQAAAARTKFLKGVPLA